VTEVLAYGTAVITEPLERLGSDWAPRAFWNSNPNGYNARLLRVRWCGHRALGYGAIL